MVVFFLIVFVSFQKWKEHSEHILAQEQGKNEWYKEYITRISKVEREYSFKVD